MQTAMAGSERQGSPGQPEPTQAICKTPQTFNMITRSVTRRFLLTLFLILTMCISCARTPPRPQPSGDFQAFIADGNHHETLLKFERHLRVNSVANVIPIEQLLRQGTDWKNNRLPQYAFPPEALWPGMARTLKFMRRFVIPAIGPVEVLSGYRTPTYNRIAGGAKRSQHLEFSALDVKPSSDLSRAELHKRLQQIWQIHGRRLNMGLGLYQGRRFHIDTGGYRQW